MNSALSDLVETSSSRVNNVYSALPDTSNVIRASNNSTADQLTTKSNRSFSCTICNIDLSNQKLFNSHLNSQQHQQVNLRLPSLMIVDKIFRFFYRLKVSMMFYNQVTVILFPSKMLFEKKSS